MGLLLRAGMYCFCFISLFLIIFFISTSWSSDLERDTPLKTDKQSHSSGIKSKVKGTFVYLVTKEKSVDTASSNSHPVWDYIGDLIVSLRFLQFNFNKKYKYPVTIFHDGLSSQEIAKILKKAGEISDLVTFHEIEFDFPRSMSSLSETQKSELNGDTCTGKPWHLDYLHMNRFFTLKMFQHPALQDFDYYIRLDTDLFVKGQIPFDLFERMRDQDLSFLFWNENTEPQNCVYGLGEATQIYAKKKKIPLGQFDERKAYHGCFGGGKLGFFQSAEYQNYADYLNELGGIYHHRWADQVIYRIALQMFGETGAGHVKRWPELGNYLQHNKRYPSDLCVIAPKHHKCAKDSSGTGISFRLASDSLKMEPRHSGAYAKVYPKREEEPPRQKRRQEKEDL